MSRGGLLIWHGMRSERLADYERWYQEEHLAERVSTPGFLSGARYERLEGPEPRFFIRYEASSPEVFLSPPYRARLAAPTPWTQSIMPAFTDMNRTVCRKAAGWGLGVTGALVCLTGQDAGALEQVARDRQGGSCLGWSLWQGVAEPGRDTAEAALRGDGDSQIEACLLLMLGRREAASETAEALKSTGEAAAYALIARMEGDEARRSLA